MIGQTVSHYRIISEIGAGGMGVVYKAEDLRLGRFVALKFLAPQLMRDADAKRRLFAEARAASALDHANVCTIYDIEETPDGRVFLSMAFCEGETLKQRLERGPLSPVDAACITVQIARGLERAHQAGIIHRDVKPGNIIVAAGGHARLLDFGIARLTADADLTKTGTTLGTAAYLSPEQVRGGDASQQSDVWALGVVLFEMVAGRRPFTGASDLELLQSIVDRPPAASPGLPDGLARIVTRALEKDPAQRFADAGELARALDDWLATTTTAAARPVPRSAMSAPRIVAAAAVALLAVAAAGWWWTSRSSGARTARTELLPQALRLAEQDRYGEAFIAAARAAKDVPDDPALQALWPRITQQVSMTTTPSDAEVSFRAADGAGEWFPIGRTPLSNARVPRGVFQWRIAAAGAEPIEVLRSTELTAVLPGLPATLALPAAGALPPEMVAVRVPAGLYLTLTGFNYMQRLEGGDFQIDRHEVTNAEFKAFVDAGGYQSRQFWTEPILQSGQTLDFAAAMALFRDRTGRPGPATWEGGTFPAGEDQLPVRGVSWYEAAAYAAFRGKQLPTIYQWTHAAGPALGGAVTRSSNVAGTGPASTATQRGLGPYGTFDMAGNVREWVWNAQTGSELRFILGGAWVDPDYVFLYPNLRSPLDRTGTNGFRCMKAGDSEPTRAALTAPVALPLRDYTKEQAANDASYRIFAGQYDYDRPPLDARVEASDETPHWRHELVNMAAAYGGERLPVHLYFPRNVKPPYQVVLHHPGSGVIRVSEFDRAFLEPVEFVILSGRALAFPIYKNTLQRRDVRVTSPLAEPTRAYATWVQQIVADARRTLDYLETRPEIDRSKVAYFGMSWGGRVGPVTLALEDRIKAGILLMGGLSSSRSVPEADPFNFAPRVRTPVLMLNGDQDFIFPLQTSQLPLFQSLGSPPADKRHVLYPGGHEIFATQRSQVVQEVVAWLDRYLGVVR